MLLLDESLSAALKVWTPPPSSPLDVSVLSVTPARFSLFFFRRKKPNVQTNSAAFDDKERKHSKGTDKALFDLLSLQKWGSKKLVHV